MIPNRKDEIYIIYINILKLIIALSLLCFVIYSIKHINININKCQNELPIDYILKQDLDKCYLKIHNFVSIDSQAKDNSTQKNFKTYIYSYTKPYLIELVQNSTENCLCCE